MSNFIFGLLWTAFTTFVFIVMFGGGSNMGIIPFLILLLFEVIGIGLLISGIKRMIKNSNTKKYGKQCYGIISDVKPTGMYINDKPEYKAIIEFVNPETNRLDTVEEIIGLNYNKYPINTYLLCKYFQGDINIETPTLDNEVPEEIKKMLGHMQVNFDSPIQTNNDYQVVSQSSNKETVIIDGEEYIIYKK